jgi:sarcosine oxidase subunit alpha
MTRITSSAPDGSAESAASSGPYRLTKGGSIDRGTVVSFRFDDQALTGFAGDTLASALLANGRRVIGRSFKYHRPRGILTAGPEEPNGLVELREGSRREPNTKATVVEIYDGLIASSQNRWPSLGFDLLGLNSLLAPFLPAGFYYKTFMWPPAFWERVYEPLIRRAAGLGRAAPAKDPDRYEQANAFCDLLIVGAGPSGISAAVTAGRAGARVMLCEDDFRFGGRLLSERHEINDRPGETWVQECLAELQSMSNVRLMPRTAVFGVYDGGMYGAIERVADNTPAPPAHLPRQRLWRIVAKRAILAAGATERSIAFGGNDRPGIQLASAMRTYANRFAVAPGRQIALFVNNDDGWKTARDLQAASIEVSTIVDSRAAVAPSLSVGLDSQIFLGGQVFATHGHHGLKAIKLRTPDGTRSIVCDALGVAGGWNPNLGLSCHLGARAVWDESIAAFVPGEPPKGMAVVGAAKGTMTLGRCLREGTLAAQDALDALGIRYHHDDDPEASDEPSAISPTWYIASRQKAFVDFQNDVTGDDVALAFREGFGEVEHLKRYTTLSMATDQGKTSSVNGLALLAMAAGKTIAQSGRTTSRPPEIPVAIGAFAGHHRGKNFRPVRRTPSHSWAESLGATFVETGLWLRAQYYPVSGETDWLATVCREVTTVRESVGFCDVSTLGKIELSGKDVGKFLDHLYINTFSTLPVGRARYGLMLREDGFALDDGTVSRLSENRFFLTTTTANAERVFQHIQFCRQVLWPELDVQMISATEKWTQFSVAGPRSRDTLAAIIDAPFSIDNEVFPFMAVAELTVCSGIAARLYRISFSGELAYEIAVPAQYGNALARRLMEVGSVYGIVPYGTEALGTMRIEKGHIAGNEIDGRTTAHDLGLGRMMSKRKDYIGRVLAERAALVDPRRPTVVGLRPVDPRNRLRAGAHILPATGTLTAEHDKGVITSVAYSPSLQHWIGLGFVEGGLRQSGERVRAVDLLRDSIIEVEVCSPCFLDPEGARARG